MKRVILLIIMLINASGFGQGYTLQRAFPNLPDFFQPTELVNSGDGTNRLFLVQQRDVIYVFNNSPTVSTRKVFLDLTSRIITHPFNAILGMAFHPDYENNGYFYIQYSVDSAANPFGLFWVKVSRFSVSPTNPDSALPNSEMPLLRINSPLEHFGGKIEFGSDGYLYSAVGDGKIAPDSAQSKTSLLGKVLRINVDSAANGKNYSIPQSNPYYQNTQGYKEEIYALGFRNPFKFSFDTPTNRLFLGDVGEDWYEEVDIVENGKNYGWNKMEGILCFPDSNNCDTAGRGFTPPIIGYPHSHISPDYVASVTGGYVYRGSLLPNLYGKYIYGDLVEGKIWALDSNMNNELIFDTTFMIVSFGVDENKELYVVSFGFGDPAHIYKIVQQKRILTLTALIEGFYNESANTMVPDTVDVYLRDGDFPYQIKDSAKGFLNNSGVGSFSFVNILNNQDLRIVVKHRNSIETWGNETVFINDTLTYDFTTSISQAFGDNLTLKGTKYCIYSGDVNQDGVINLVDLLEVYNNQNTFVTGYVRGDVNGNNIIDLGDLIITYNNSTLQIAVEDPF